MVGNLGELMSAWSQGITDFTKGGKCSGCGQCCTDILPLTELEKRRIRAYIAEHGIKENVHRPPTNVPVLDVTCPFRNDTEHKCDIYEVRPAVCKKFICSKPQTEESKLKPSKRVYSMRRTFFGGKK